MSKQESKTHVQQIGTVFVPVSNQEKVLDFYINKLGFEKRVDASYSYGKRWIEVAPSNSNINLALVFSEEGKPATDERTTCAFSTNNIEADFETFRKKGVDIVDEKIGKLGTSRSGLISTHVSIENPMPPQFSFRDPDGNRFLIVEP